MRHILFPFLVLALLLVACRGDKSQPQVESTTVPEPTAVAYATAPSGQALAATLPAPADQAPPPGCTIISPRPTPGPTEQSLFPPAGEADWTIGPDSAQITFIEYSDFQ